MLEANPQWNFVDSYVDEGISGIQTDKRTEFQGMITFIFNSDMSHSLKGEDVVELDVDKNVEKVCSDTYGNCSETK
ncbi:putative site-specific recombinase [Clostridium botulinum]|nr:putative site-specific recombinase [Clostridium botulinum]